MCRFAVKVSKTLQGLHSDIHRYCSSKRLAQWGDLAVPITITLIERSSLCFLSCQVQTDIYVVQVIMVMGMCITVPAPSGTQWQATV